MKATALYFISRYLGTALVLGTMAKRVNLNDPKDCLWWFKNVFIYKGTIISSGFIGEYKVRTTTWGEK